MNIESLKQLIPHPAEPTFPGSQKEWIAFEKKTGLRFPEEYYTLLNIYGSGRFLGGEFKVANPFDPDDENFAEHELRRLRETKVDHPDEVPYPLFPEAGGLYPFGIDGNGNTFLWITNSSSDKWTIVCFNSEDYSETINCSLIEFLILLASNKLKINRRKFWGGDFLQDQLEFVPRKPKKPRQKKPTGK